MRDVRGNGLEARQEEVADSKVGTDAVGQECVDLRGQLAGAVVYDIEDLPWAHPPTVSSEERKRLAKKLSHGKPLSEIIIEDREGVRDHQTIPTIILKS